MKKLRNRIIWLLTLALAGVTAASALPGFKATTKDAMKRKLQHAQKTLEAVAMENYGEIQKNADALIRLSETEDWHALRTDEYRLFSDEFRRNVVSLQKAAKARNIDAASLAYVQMTITCVNCHKYVRGKQKVASL